LAEGKLVTVSSHDFVFNKRKSGWCNNDTGKVDLTNDFFYHDQTYALRNEIINYRPDKSEMELHRVDLNKGATALYKETITSWCKHLFGSGEPHSRLGEFTWRPVISDIDWEGKCHEAISLIAGPTGDAGATMAKSKKNRHWNPNYLHVCRFNDGELVTNLLTDKKYMDPAQNNSPHRIDEVKNTCFKSKWQTHPWILVDLETEKSVGKVKLFNRLEAKGNWKIGNYPVYPELKEMPEVKNKPWVWDRFGDFQVFVMKEGDKWRTWAKNNRWKAEYNHGSGFYSTGDGKRAVDFSWEVNFPFDYWEIAKANPDSGRIGRDKGTKDEGEAKAQNLGFGDPNYPEKLKKGDIPEYQLCDKDNNGGIKKMDAWRTEFHDDGAHEKEPWLTFAKKNYPFVVDCGGLQGRYVAVRLLNVGRTENKETNFLNNAPLTMCEIQVEEA